MDELRTIDEELMVEGETTQFIVIRIGDEQYGISIKFIDNIVRMKKITRVPKVAEHLLGIINIRGEVIPVMSLRLKMDLEKDVITNDTRVIILKTDVELIGVLVDAVKEVMTLENSSIEKVGHDGSKEEKQNFISGVGNYNGGLVSILDLNMVLAEKENV